MKRKICLELLLTFMKIGLFTFGGGYAMIALIERSCVEQKGWITHDDMMDITVLAESTPGPIAINCATFVGARQAGFAGAAAATLGVILPSFVIIYGISRFMDSFLQIALVAKAFRGIRVAVGLLILDAAVTMLCKMRKKPLSVAFFLGAFAAMLAADLLALRLSTVALMLLAAALSLAVFAAQDALRRKGGGAR